MVARADGVGDPGAVVVEARDAEPRAAAVRGALRPRHAALRTRGRVHHQRHARGHRRAVAIIIAVCGDGDVGEREQHARGGRGRTVGREHRHGRRGGGRARHGHRARPSPCRRLRPHQRSTGAGGGEGAAPQVLGVLGDVGLREQLRATPHRGREVRAEVPALGGEEIEHKSVKEVSLVIAW